MEGSGGLGEQALVQALLGFEEKRRRPASGTQIVSATSAV